MTETILCFNVTLWHDYFKDNLQIQTWKLMSTVNASRAFHLALFLFFFGKWMNRPFSVSWGPFWECHCAFQTSLCYYIPLFALHVLLSTDWLSWCLGRFSRYPWIPLIHPSFKSYYVCRHLPSHNLAPWGCELRRIPWDGEITIKPRSFCDKRRICWVLHLCPLLSWGLSGSETCEVRDLMTWAVFAESETKW